jgi:hypothetical protein
MTLEQITTVAQILSEAGVSPDEYFDAQHDVIYIPWFEKDGDVAERLQAAGCHFSGEAGSWALY